MPDRRQFIIGGACLAATGVAYAAQPRRAVALLGDRKLDDVVPVTAGVWTSRSVNDLVQPKEEGSLASRLYSQTVGRIYTNGNTGAEIMMLLAYGTTQSDDLQLHRPEVCYPVFGFSLSRNEPLNVPLPGGGILPTRRLVADAPGRRENIIYWSRLGEYLPIDGSEQRADRLRTAFKGIVADGLLARFSHLEESPERAWAATESFIVELLKATAPQNRPPLIGSNLSAKWTSGLSGSAT